jgi:ribose transport system substrate-binding protein
MSSTVRPGGPVRTDVNKGVLMTRILSSPAGRSAAAAALVAAFAVAGCSNTGIGQSPTESPAEDPENVTLGLAGSFLTDPFQVVLVNTIGEEAEAAGANMLPATNADADPAQQVTDIQNLLAQDISALIAIPVDSDAIVPGIEQANSAGVPVVTVDVAPNGGDVFMVVRADNYAMGVSACEAMGEAIGGEGTVLNLQGNLASVNGLERSNGFTECMEENYPEVEIISRPTDWVTEQAVSEAQTVLSTEDIAGIFMASDSVMADGIRNVLTNQDKWLPTDDPDHIALVSIDGTPLGLELVREGYFDAVISQPVDLYSQYATQYAIDAASGVEYEPGPTDHDSEIVEENGMLADKLPSPTVTMENVDDPALWGNSAE